VRRETLFAAMQTHLALVAAQQNDIVKRLAAWGAIAFTPTIVFSLYGMNFQHMPELQWSYGYPFTFGVTAMVCVWLYRKFNKELMALECRATSTKLRTTAPLYLPDGRRGQCAQAAVQSQ
jgi:hypothetical protein